MFKKSYFPFLGLFGFFSFLSGAFAQTPTFSDVPATSPYFTEVEYLAQKKVIHGYPNGTYLPKGKINRAELTKLMVAMQGIDPDPKVYRNCFPDVQTQWFAPYVCYAKEKKWIQGYADGTFKPADFVSAAESLKIILNPLFADEIAKQSPQEIEVGIKNFYDIKKTDWFAPYVAFAERRAIIFEGSGMSYGKGDSFYLYSPIRGIIAQIIFRGLMVKESNLQTYHDYYADKILKEQGFADLLSGTSSCYSLGNLEFNFYSSYLSSKYGIQKPYQGLEALFYLHYFKENPEELYDFYGTGFADATTFKFPLFDPGYFCDLGEKGYLFSSAMALAEDNVSNHFIYFDQKGVLIEDKKADCSEWKFEFSSPPFNPTVLKGLNLSELEWVNCMYIKDKENVYFVEGGKIEGADPTSFQALNLIYAKDAAHVFYRKKMVEGADVNTFQGLEGGYGRDVNHIFLNGVLMKQYDAASFEVIDEHYSKDKNGVYYNYNEDYMDLSSGGLVIQLIGAKPETVKILEGNYAVDGDKVYYYGNLISSADGNTFQVHGYVEDSYGRGFFASDKNYPYIKNQIAEWFDAKTMQMIDGLFVKKGDQFYYNFGYEIQPFSSEVEDLTAEDFKDFTVLQNAPVFPGSWSRAGGKIYLMYVHLAEVSDASAFEFINKIYSKDSKNVFHLNQKSGGAWQFFAINGADPATFKPLAADDTQYSHFAKDAKNVYYKLQTLQTGTLDLATAELVKEAGVIKDAKGYTCKIDTTTATVLSCN